jgi:hypothetical protein
MPLLEDLGVAASAEPRMSDRDPFVFIGERRGLGLGASGGGGFREAVGQRAMAGVARRSPEPPKNDGIYQRPLAWRARPGNVDFSVRGQKN